MTSRASEWSWDVDPCRGVSSVKMLGALTGRDILSAQHGLTLLRGFDPSFALVVDLTMVSDLSLTWFDARTIIARSPIAPQSARAIVAPTIISAVMAHAFRAVREDVTGIDVVRVCRSMQEAHAWLTARCPPAGTA